MAAYPELPKQRAPALRQLREKKVAAGTHAFIRASAGFFYAEVERLGPGAVPAGPEIWICGDCHAENIGAISGEGAAPAIEMNDFDETVIGAPALDVLRMALALAAVGRTAGFTAGEVRELVDAMLEGYGQALSAGREKLPVPPRRYRRLLHRAGAQTHRALLDRRVPAKGGKRRFAMGDRYWPLAAGEKRAVGRLVDDERVIALVAAISAREIDDRAEMIDAAFRVAGTGSLGCFRAAALVRGGEGEGDAALHLLDVKEAMASHAPRASATPPDDAQRIRDGARAMAPALGDRMVAIAIDGTLRAATLTPRGQGRRSGVIVRELMPQELKSSLDGLEREEAAASGHFLGAVVGRAHRRQLTLGEARPWYRAVRDPRWLHRALPALLGAHEQAYLAQGLMTA